jgi:large subunit ribosomal protein L21
MYAVIETGGKQYRVSKGLVLLIEKINGDAGDVVALERVLAVSQGDSLLLGEPILPNASVSAQILEQTKGDKVYAFRFKRRKGMRKKVGHRQLYTRIKIKEITA